MGRAEEQRLPRAPLERKHSWLAALLGASIFSSCFLLTQAQSGSRKIFLVTQKPENPKEGQNVTLTPDGNLDGVIICNWCRGSTAYVTKRIFVYFLNGQSQVNGAAYTGRETGGADCSLHIRNLTTADSGNYTVTKQGFVNTVGHVYVEVSVPPPSESGIYITSLLIIIGSVAVILALIGTLLYFFLRARRQRDGTSSQTIPTLSLYGILSSSGQVKPANSAVSNIYQTLEPGSQSVYDELRC